MPDRNRRTNLLLLLVMVLICTGCALLFRQSTAYPSKVEGGTVRLFASEDTEKPEADNGSSKTDVSESEEKVSPAATPTATPVPFEVSPEAEKGVWTSSGSNWMFMVDGQAYTGWLTDTDGKRYFFDSSGIMKTGWVDDGGKRYFMDLDGIMQTGFITTEGKSYELLSDGSLKGYKAAEKKADNKKTPEQTKAPEKEASRKEASDSQKKKSQKKKYIALTFDDGPSSFTDRLLDCLEANNAKATFFMVGKEIEYFSDQVKRMETLGCELGNHTYSHTDLSTLAPEDMSAEIAGVDELLTELTGHGATVVRPPYGSVNSSVKETVGTPMILWSIDTLDWESQDPQKIVDTTLSQVEDGSIILMHDIFSTTVDAAEILIPQLKKQGYEMVTVHELAKRNGIQLGTGTTYSCLLYTSPSPRDCS